MENKEFKLLAKERLSPKRYLHTCGVVDAARDLAVRYGADPEQAMVAGWLHDLTKECSVQEQLNLCDRFGIVLSDLERRSPKLWHAKTAAGYARECLGVEDPTVLDALRYHTTGRANMTILDKIVYLADYIEVNRTFDGVEEVRALIDEGLDAMMLQAMKQTIEELLEKSASIHPDTFLCYNQLVSERAK